MANTALRLLDHPPYKRRERIVHRPGYITESQLAARWNIPQRSLNNHRRMNGDVPKFEQAGSGGVVWYYLSAVREWEARGKAAAAAVPTPVRKSTREQEIDQAAANVKAAMELLAEAMAAQAALITRKWKPEEVL